MTHDALLATKLTAPPARPALVSRPRLLDRLDRIQDCGLALVSAPAGFGKTTLLREWLASSDRPAAAWLSLDADDNDLPRFLSYLTAALAIVAPEAVQEVQNLLRLPQQPPAEPILASLINGLSVLETGVTLILDDYHTIEARPIHSALTFLLDHRPPMLHLAVATRVDPPLPLSRWRSRGLMVEVHAADLRFTSEETAAYLNEAMSLNLEPDDVDALSRRTEGWIVGLQMAALALQGKRLPEESSSFVQAFSGTHRYILDYLVEEVLALQPSEVQTFLLQTSILSRLSGPLCDALRFGSGEAPSTPTGDAVRFGSGEAPSTPTADAVRLGSGGAPRPGDDRTVWTDGQSMLETLDAANLFLIPLDDQRRWYRYHHLFAEMLRARLHRTSGQEGLVSLHTRAAEWYEGQGWVEPAFKHAIAAQDFDHAGRLIEENWLRIGHAGQMYTILRWLESMPDEVVRARPMLSGAYAWVLWLTGHMDAVEPWLDAAGAIWERQAAEGTMDPDHVRWQAGGPALRTNLVRHRGQLREAIQFAHQTLEMAAEGDALLHSYGHLGLAHAYRELGDYARSLSAYEKGVPLARAAGNLASANIAAFYLSRVLELQGHLHRAAKVLHEAIRYTESKGLGGSPAPAILHFGLANLLCEWNDLPQAQAHLQRGQELARLGGHHELQRNGAIVLARLRLVGGDANGALAAIEEAQQATATAEMPLASAELAAHQARVRLALGDLSAAARWAEEAASRRGQDRGYTRHIEATILARVYLASGKLEPAIDQLATCQRMAEGSSAAGWGIEIGLLGALAREARGDRAGALSELERALLQAEPEGHVQVFVAEGEPMAALLRRVVARGIAPRYVARLLKALGAAARPGPSPLVEPLSERELEVLRLMAAGLSNREIAAELVLALGTVKAHLHNIYGKLGVQSRVQAAARARELQLL